MKIHTTWKEKMGVSAKQHAEYSSSEKQNSAINVNDGTITMEEIMMVVIIIFLMYLIFL